MYTHLALSENGFLFDSQSGKTYSLNATGSFILRNLINGKDSSTLCDLVEETFDIQANKATRDVDDFLLRLHDLRIIVLKETNL